MMILKITMIRVIIVLYCKYANHIFWMFIVFAGQVSWWNVFTKKQKKGKFIPLIYYYIHKFHTEYQVHVTDY